MAKTIKSKLIHLTKRVVLKHKLNFIGYYTPTKLYIIICTVQKKGFRFSISLKLQYATFENDTSCAQSSPPSPCSTKLSSHRQLSVLSNHTKYGATKAGSQAITGLL